MKDEEVVDIRCTRTMGRGDSDSKKQKWERHHSALGKPLHFFGVFCFILF